MLFDPYTLAFKSKGVVFYRLRCLDWFITVVANINTDRAVNNEVVFLSSKQPSKRLRGHLYSLVYLGFLGEGRREAHGASLCSCSGFALRVRSPEAAPLSPVLPRSLLPRPERLVGSEGFFLASSLTVTNDFIQQNGSVRGIILALISQTSVMSPT